MTENDIAMDRAIKELEKAIRERQEQKLRFVDERHERAYKELAEKVNLDIGDRDRVLLIYLMAVVEPPFDDVMEINEFGRVVIKPDALQHGWVTGGDARLIRLAFHLYSYDCPTAINLSGPEELREVKEYLPFNFLLGLDSRGTAAALEALRLLCYW